MKSCGRKTALNISHGTTYLQKKLKKSILKTDSIRKLAEFWGTHDLTDFLDELEEVTEPVFTGRDMVMEIHLSSDEVEKVRKIAKFQGIGVADLIHKWIVEQAYLVQRERKIV